MFTPDQAPFLAATRVCMFASSPPQSGCTTRPASGDLLTGAVPGRRQTSSLGSHDLSYTKASLNYELWTDTKAVGTTAEPTHAANWCFSMPPRRKKLLEDHRQWGFSMPCTAGVICRALPLQGGGWKWERKYTNRQSSPTVKGRLKPGVVTTRYHWKTPVRGHVGSATELWRDSINNITLFLFLHMFLVSEPKTAAFGWKVWALKV